jgi:hypothetical protein
MPELANECCDGQEKNGKWKVCTDLNDLNKCCPKDDFPLSRIDKVVDSAAGCETMTLLDCFSRYHQIWLCQEDEGKKVLSCLLAPIAILGCPKDSRMLAQYYAK